MRSKMLVALFLTGCISLAAQKVYSMQSPGGKLRLAVTIRNDIRFSLDHEGTSVLAPSVVGMTLQNGTALGKNPKVAKVHKTGADRVARDYKKEVRPVPADCKLKINMAPGEGFAVRIFK